MDPTNVLLLTIHVAVAAVAFSILLPIGSAIGRASDKGLESKVLAAEIAGRSAKLFTLFSAFALVTGLMLIFYRGGMGAVPPSTHPAMMLVFFLVLIGWLFLLPLGGKLKTAAEGEDQEAFLKGKKKWAMYSGIAQLLWLVTLGLMFIK